MSNSTRMPAESLVPVTRTGWRTGLSNLLRKETGEWFEGVTPIWTTLIWLGLIDGIMAMALLTERSQGAEVSRLLTLGAELYASLTSIFAGVGVAIACVDAIVGERELGTAAFILSKPVSRASFVLAKFLGNVLGTLVTAIAIPGAVSYGLIWAVAGHRLPLMRFTVSMLVLLVGLSFYIALSLLLGTLFKSKGPVIGIPIALIMGHQMINSLIPQIVYVAPWALPDLVKVYILEGSLTSPLPLIAVPFTIAVLLVAAIARFEVEDL